MRGTATAAGRRDDTLRATVEYLERAKISRALKECGGNRTHAAKRLGVSRWGLIQKIERYGLSSLQKQ